MLGILVVLSMLAAGTYNGVNSHIENGRAERAAYEDRREAMIRDQINWDTHFPSKIKASYHWSDTFSFDDLINDCPRKADNVAALVGGIRRNKMTQDEAIKALFCLTGNFAGAVGWSEDEIRQNFDIFLDLALQSLEITKKEKKE